MPILVDTGAFYALADRDDAWHERMRDHLHGRNQVLMAPVSVVPEVCYLLRSRLGPGAERVFAESLSAGEVAVEGLTQRDLARCAELLAQYEFLGFVDASVVAIAERLKLTSLVTTDRRDFRRVRPRHVRSFELLP